MAKLCGMPSVRPASPRPKTSKVSGQSVDRRGSEEAQSDELEEIRRAEGDDDGVNLAVGNQQPLTRPSTAPTAMESRTAGISGMPVATMVWEVMTAETMIAARRKRQSRR